MIQDSSIKCRFDRHFVRSVRTRKGLDLYMSTKLASLLEYCSDNWRVCPLPLKWDTLWKLLPNRQRHGTGWEPALPLILAAWYEASDTQKALRLREHLEWAENNGALDTVDRFLRDLPTSDWHYLDH